MHARGDAMKTFAIAALFAILTASAARADCSDLNLAHIETNIRWCNSDCNQSGHQRECSGYGKMGGAAASHDWNGVREGFEQCHDGQGGVTGEMQACFRERQADFGRTACNVFGCNPPPPPPLKPVIKGIEFNKAMSPASDDKHIVIADFVLPGAGEYREITLDFRRDDKRTFRLSTYAVNVEPAPGGLHVKITTYDVGVANVKGHTYTVAGTLYVLTMQ